VETNLLLEMVPIFSVLLIYFARIAELKTVRDTTPGEVREHLTLKLFVAIGTLMVVASIAEYLLHAPSINPFLFLGGWACAVASFSLRRSAIKALGKMWSLHVEIREGHQLVLGGPYRWVRHPAYLSMVLELLAFSLLLESLAVSIVLFPVFFAVLAFRIRIEERALVNKVAGYAQYRQSTPAIFPYKVPS